MFAKLATAILALCFASTSFAADSSVSFTKLHARPSAGKVGVAFFTVISTTNDTLIGLTSDCCKAVELHRTEKINGVMSMRRIAELTLKKETPVDIQPTAKGGEHLMLIGLTKPLVDGDSVTVTFTLKKAGEKKVTFPVAAASADDDVHELH